MKNPGKQKEEERSAQMLGPQKAFLTESNQALDSTVGLYYFGDQGEK